MRLRNRCYTYPVLSIDSDYYVDSAFVSDVNMINRGFEIEFKFKVELNNTELQQLLYDGDVIIVHHIECPKTSYRQALRTRKFEDTVSISIGMIDNRIEIISFLVANKDIEAYKNECFSNYYKGFAFNISRGCIMAIGNEYVFHVTKSHDELKDIPSVFSIVQELESDTKSVQYVLNKDKIVIKISKDAYELYVRLASNRDIQPIMHSMIIVPGLIYILQLLQQDREALFMYEERRWFRALRKACRLQDVDIENMVDVDVVELAQKLLDNPLNRAFEYLKADMIGAVDDEA